jgi:endo-beta-N-acetylglucosaminidase D
MNNINPTEVVQLWQEKLSDARRELADFEQRLGELALVNDAIELAQRLTLLRDAVTIAEAALVTAQRKAPAPRVTQKREQLERAHAEAAKWKAEAEKWGAIQEELEPRWVEARDRTISAMKLMMQHESSAQTYQFDLNDLLRESEQH